MSRGVKVTMKLDKELIRRITKQSSKKATWSALDHLATVSKQQVPLDQGELMASCQVDVNDDGSEGTISYDTPYAVPQHENMNYQHQRGRKAKYLEDPASDAGVQHEMVEVIKSVFESNIGG